MSNIEITFTIKNIQHVTNVCKKERKTGKNSILRQICLTETVLYLVLLFIYLFAYLSSHCLCIRCILSFDPRCKLQYMTGWSQDENPVISDSIISCNNFTPLKYRKQINSLALDTALTVVDKHTWYGCSSWTSACHLMTLFQISCWTKFMHWLKYVTRCYISSPNAPRLSGWTSKYPKPQYEH